jgi:hypothetical protein
MFSELKKRVYYPKRGLTKKPSVVIKVNNFVKKVVATVKPRGERGSGRKFGKIKRSSQKQKVSQKTIKFKSLKKKKEMA